MRDPAGVEQPTARHAIQLQRGPRAAQARGTGALHAGAGRRARYTEITGLEALPHKRLTACAVNLALAEREQLQALEPHPQVRDTIPQPGQDVLELELGLHDLDAALLTPLGLEDKSSGPTAGAETVDTLEFLAQVVSHIPDKGQVLQRYYGCYANRTRGMRRQHSAEEHEPVVYAEPVPDALRAARRRWAEWLRRLVEVDPLRCPRCGHEMRIVAFITQPQVIDRIPASGGVLGCGRDGWGQRCQPTAAARAARNPSSGAQQRVDHHPTTTPGSLDGPLTRGVLWEGGLKFLCGPLHHTHARASRNDDALLVEL